MITPFRRASLIGILILTVSPGNLLAVTTEKSSALLFVKDALTAPGQPVTIEAKLVEKRFVTSAPRGGEPLELVIDGQVVTTTMTGVDGRGFLTYLPKKQVLVPVEVRVGTSPRVQSTSAQANLAVWEKRQPILLVELAALLEESAPSRVPSIGVGLPSERPAIPDASDELGKLTQFYYRIIYVVTVPAGGDGAQVSAEVRAWLKTQKFPTGYVMAISPDTKALGTKLDEFHTAGWKTMKVGVGRSKAFAEVFLQRRLDAIMVPEPSKGDVPRKVKVAKDWKEVRKRL
jgi:hypothetical protein